MERVFIGMGSNMGDRMANLATAVDMISDLDLTHVKTVSHAYESEPWGDPAEPMFANAVIEVSTGLEPRQLLEALQDIEREMGREPGPANAPRLIDLDIVLFGDTELSSDDLVIPHPRAAERMFVIQPLMRIAPGVTWPDGSEIDASIATEGRIVRDFGPILDEGADHNRPIGDMEWVAVAEASDATPTVSSPDFGLMYQASILQEEEIPFAWDPWDPADVTDPWGVGVTLKLLVPASAAERARALLADAEAASPVLDEDVEFAIESESEDPAERE